MESFLVEPLGGELGDRPHLRGHGIGSWLFCHGCAWLRLGGSHRILVYAQENEDLPRIERYYAGHGLVRITRTRRGWKLLPSGRPLNP